MEGQEQNRSEAPTPFKLQKAREKGMVARSIELGFAGGLIALAAFVLIAGGGFAQLLARSMRTALASTSSSATGPDVLRGITSDLGRAIVGPLALFGVTVMTSVLLLELIQLRGFLFSTQALKPDFTRLNPAKGLKRLFSARVFKETLKTIAKMIAYCLATWVVIRMVVDRFGLIAGDGERLAGTLESAALRLLFAFMLVAFGFVVLDQVLVRGEFLKQMRMSRREVTREAREREGEPRIRQRRKQLHAELLKQGKGIGALAGSDLLIVNPEHFAVALRYDDERMDAPVVSAKGRNAHALRLKAEAHRRGLAVVVDPPLARSLYRACAIDRTIPADRYEAVARHYIELRRRSATNGAR